MYTPVKQLPYKMNLPVTLLPLRSPLLLALPVLPLPLRLSLNCFLSLVIGLHFLVFYKNGVIMYSS